MQDTDLGQIILSLTDAAQSDIAATALLRVLADAVRADAGTMWLDGAEWRLGATDPVATALPNDLRSARLGRVYGPDDWPLRIQPLPPRGDGRVIGVALPHGAVWVALIRTRGTLRALDAARLSSLAPHLAQAVTLAQRLHASRQTSDDYAFALQRLSVGVLQFDRTKAPLPVADKTARSLLAAFGLNLSDLARSWPRSEGEHLTEITPDLDLVTLSRREGARSLGLLRPRQGSLPAPATLARGLGLTLAEARLAHALAQSTRIDDSARQLGLTDATARFYTKQIFAKTGCSGQPALMRRIWASALLLLR